MAGRPASIHLETAYQEAPVAAIARVTQLLLLAHQRRSEAQGGDALPRGAAAEDRGAAPHGSAQDSNPAEVKAAA